MCLLCKEGYAGLYASKFFYSNEQWSANVQRTEGHSAFPANTFAFPLSARRRATKINVCPGGRFELAGVVETAMTADDQAVIFNFKYARDIQDGADLIRNGCGARFITKFFYTPALPYLFVCFYHVLMHGIYCTSSSRNNMFSSRLHAWKVKYKSAV